MADDFSDPFKMFRDLWKPLETPVPTLPGLFSAEELDRKITELKTVENWLTVNLNMLQMSIKTLEMQRGALAAMQAVAKPDKDPK